MVFSPKQIALNTGWSLETLFNQSGPSLLISGQLAHHLMKPFGVSSSLEQVEKAIGSTINLVYGSQNISGYVRSDKFDGSLGDVVEIFRHAAPILVTLHLLGALKLSDKTVAILNVTSGLATAYDQAGKVWRGRDTGRVGPGDVSGRVIYFALLFLTISRTVNAGYDLTKLYGYSPPELLHSLHNFFSQEKSVFFTRFFAVLFLVDHCYKLQSLIDESEAPNQGRMQGPFKPERKELRASRLSDYINKLKPKGVVETILVLIEPFGKAVWTIPVLKVPVDLGKAFYHVDQLRQHFFLPIFACSTGKLIGKIAYVGSKETPGYIEMATAISAVLKDFGGAMKYLAKGPIPALAGNIRLFADMKNIFSIVNTLLGLLPSLGVTRFSDKEETEIRGVWRTRELNGQKLQDLPRETKHSLTKLANISAICFVIFQLAYIAYNFMELAKGRKWYAFTSEQIQWSRRVMSVALFGSIFQNHTVKKMTNLESQEWLSQAGTGILP